ncbi:hypothetical protein [Nocardioides sp. J54]|uniref:hypothetical protein n=1 Tax=Nocardioides sp. J54 TaxID=935866 RepID=UPI000491CCF4|nr:hypothetical protein [Nocardioides sp. J54]
MTPIQQRAVESFEAARAQRQAIEYAEFELVVAEKPVPHEVRVAEAQALLREQNVLTVARLLGVSA